MEVIRGHKGQPSLKEMRTQGLDCTSVGWGVGVQLVKYLGLSSLGSVATHRPWAPPTVLHEALMVVHGCNPSAAEVSLVCSLGSPESGGHLPRATQCAREVLEGGSPPLQSAVHTSCPHEGSRGGYCCYLGLWSIWGAGFNLSVIADIRVMGDMSARAAGLFVGQA